ncbi:MAG: cytochrome c [Chitinophagaceae bacterium]
MNKILSTLIFAGLSFCLLTSCSGKKEELPVPPVNCDTTNVRYSTTILAIMNEHCYRCHTPATNVGGPNLGTYTELALQASNGNLLSSVNHEEGHPPMPMNAGKLNDCDLTRIRIWVESGFPDN